MIKPPFQTLAPVTPEYPSDIRNPCGDATRWCCLDDQSSEIEVLHFLRCLVVLLKPDVIVETPCTVPVEAATEQPAVRQRAARGHLRHKRVVVVDAAVVRIVCAREVQ